MTNNLKDVQKVANDFDNDLQKLNLELKRIASVKCRLKKQKCKSTYQAEMQKVLVEEQLLKEAKSLVEPKKTTVTTMTQSDIDILDYDETIKAIKSIQSKKCLSRWLTPDEKTNDVYQSALKIESLLLDHKKHVQPIENTTVRKTDVQTIINSLQNNDQLDKATIVELLNKLM